MSIKKKDEVTKMYVLDISHAINCSRFGRTEQVRYREMTDVKTEEENLFIMLTEGTACFCVDGVEWRLRQGSVLLIPAHTPYTANTDDFFSCYYCHFSGQMEECRRVSKRLRKEKSFESGPAPVDDSYIYLPAVTMLEEQTNRILHWLIQCTEYAASGTRIGRLLINAEFYKILLTLSDMIEREEQTSVPSTIHRIQLYIRRNLTQPLGLRHICEVFRLSPSHVERLFKTHLNMTVTEYINDEKMRLACELIQSSPLTLTQISKRLGYSSVSYFTRRFKRKFGQPPTKMFSSQKKTPD